MVTRPTAKKVKSLDELLQADGMLSIPAKYEENGIMLIEFDIIRPFRNHPFHLYKDERLDDLVESIRTNGILIPMIVRKIDADQNGYEYEMLAGHNRLNGAKLAGLTEGPCIVKESILDEEALVYVIETNVIQRSFTDMLPTEKATVLAMSHSKMFSQGKRNDIIEELLKLENPEYVRHDETCSPVGNKLKSLDKVGIEYGLSKNTVARLLRVDKLDGSLKERVDSNEISLRCAVDLSYLIVAEQEEVSKVLSENEFKVDMKKAEMMRNYSTNSKLNEKTIYQILSGEINKKQKVTTAPSIKIKHKVYSKFFLPETKTSEIEKVVEEALKLYFQTYPDRMDDDTT
ncbi:MAG TPA: ParB N-terminal domain-containing protein [Ruminiclostridium sp.]